MLIVDFIKKVKEIVVKNYPNISTRKVMQVKSQKMIYCYKTRLTLFLAQKNSFFLLKPCSILPCLIWMNF